MCHVDIISTLQLRTFKTHEFDFIELNFFYRTWIRALVTNRILRSPGYLNINVLPFAGSVFWMLILLLLLQLRNLYSLLQQFVLFSFNSSVASNKYCIFLTSFPILLYSFVCLFITIMIIIICRELGFARPTSVSPNSLFKRLPSRRLPLGM